MKQQQKGEEKKERVIFPLDWNPTQKEQIIIPQEVIGATADEWLARKSILTEKARVWIVGEANKERAEGNWGEEAYAFFKKEMRTMEPTPLRDLMEGDVVISTRCEKGGYCLNYVLQDGQVTGFSNHAST
jgi:hypothetical protein